MEIKVYRTLPKLSAAAAKAISQLASKAIAERGRFTIALSGGNTPRSLYETIARDYSTIIDWKHVHLFWGDERYVAHDNIASNFRMTREALQNDIDIPAKNIHPIPFVKREPLDSALAYDFVLMDFFGKGIPEFDLVLLGLGNDGHTASLFPGMPEKRMVMGNVRETRSPVAPFDRISLTLPVINNARNVFFLVAGEEKKNILKAVLADEGNADSKYPAARVSPKGELVWFVDEACSRGL